MIVFPTARLNSKLSRRQGTKFVTDLSSDSVRGSLQRRLKSRFLDGTIDLAVHSMKDLPTDMPDGLCIAAIPVREDPRDVLVTQSGLLLDQLPKGAKIGTTSPRRKSQLLHLRPDLQVLDVRGNLDTRLRKLHETALDAVILAAAGIKRLIGEEIITEYFEADRMVPAAGQGALGVEAREDDLEIKTLLDAINDSHSETEVFAERVVLGELGGGCQVPIGVNARLEDGNLHLIATVCSPDGKHRLLERLSSSSLCAQELAVNLATKLIQNGAHKLENET